MCGIFCHVSRHEQHTLPGHYAQVLRQRGPDSLEHHSIRAGNYWIFFAASVLSLREPFVQQPLVDPRSSSVFCWNGEAWKVSGKRLDGNDGHAVFDMLLSACSDVENQPANVLRVFSRISGPFAFVFYDAPHQALYFSRDCLGRRSLLSRCDDSASLLISSVGDLVSNNVWNEVEANGIYVVDLNHTDLVISHFPLSYVGDVDPPTMSLCVPYPRLNHAQPNGQVPRMALTSAHLLDLESLLVNSLSLRLNSLPGSHHHPVAVLFSGGLDSTLLAYYSHVILPPETPMDLINVAFQNPRVHKVETDDPYSKCPDRITGLSAWSTLCHTCPGRQFRMVCVNVPYQELQAEAPTIKALLHPHNTEMDFSIGCALYYASKASGMLFESPAETIGKPYTSSSRILLSGLGADELFAGYNRHAIAFGRNGYKGLVEELELDFNRLGKRNLGRDDRVTSHWSREVRYPFLDEDLVAWAVQAPVWEKCGFGMESGQGTDEDPDIEPGKLALRLLAWKAGMKDVAKEKKRAIQFGSRTAKMHSGKSKGTDSLS